MQKMRRCKIKKSYLGNIVGNIYTFSDRDNVIYSVNLNI